ncbi:ABC transporter [Anaerocolumna cellulosilytica]|uniref:ABC transporter n=1 Tax=Anaerocolumna cellulosilytica TaxID=433286 RepID=A0A6S6R0E1_9FIRM|nr:ABC transporter ATP-binding protein [Anaerocolumna cellulosilytica]MBB5196232.1 ATP-binding cassette subfamily B protein [Anaerocolumna cellulosilytica]BCJ92448.1 ABC transporter [Anaerocolumna cellulosilytica]
MKKITKYIRKYWYVYVIAIVCMIVSISLDMLSPQITKRIIDDVIVGQDKSQLTKLLTAILIIGVGRSIFGYIKELSFDLVSSKIACDIRRNLFRHIQTLSVHFFDKQNTGELMSHVKDDVDKLWNALGFVGMLVIEVVFHISIVLYCMISLSPKLTIIPIIAMPIVACIAFLMEKKLGVVYEQISEENAELNTVAQENLAGVRTVKAFAREKFEIKKFLSHNKRYYDLHMKQSKIFVKYNPYFQLITKLLPITVIIFGGVMVINGEISLGTLGAFTEYSNNIIWPMEMLAWLSNELASAFASNKRVKKILQETPSIEEKESPIVLGQVKGDIEFNHVSYSHGEKEILKDISFKLGHGKTIGIMGATGAGKTSIINLLQRFYDVEQGTIKLDGVDVKDLSLHELRKNISLVMQDVFLFSDTVTENIKLGKRCSITEEEILQSVSNAQARDFIERMESQYDTIIGERGVGLSGGQKQRISIARALAKKTPILVLDDSTSALDMETEHLIQKSLNDLKNVSKIIIAHRISAVRNADEIIILEEGTIAERGTHEELLSSEGLYYKTYLAQYGEYINDNSLAM